MPHCDQLGCTNSHLYLYRGRLYCLEHLPVDEFPLAGRAAVTRERCRQLRLRLRARRERPGGSAP